MNSGTKFEDGEDETFIGNLCNSGMSYDDALENYKIYLKDRKKEEKEAKATKKQ